MDSCCRLLVPSHYFISNIFGLNPHCFCPGDRDSIACSVIHPLKNADNVFCESEFGLYATKIAKTP